MLHYQQFERRKPDMQYRNLLMRILTEGKEVESQQEEGALMLFGHQMRFELENGFPIITERDLVSASGKNLSIFHQALGELFGFLNGAHTQDQLKEFGCRWWKPWVTKEKCEKRGLHEGELGPGSYGPAWRQFPTSEVKPFDQISHLITQIKELPHLRTHFVSPWIPQYIGRGKGKQQKVVVAPCHGWIHVHIDTKKKKLSLHHFQRSADVPVGLVCNLIQYAALTMMLGQVTGYSPSELVYTISDAHIYKNQLKDVADILATNPQSFPTVLIDARVDDIFAFRQTHFTVLDYYPQLPRRKIWTPV
jgi:thymidylate synthase